MSNNIPESAMTPLPQPEDNQDVTSYETISNNIDELLYQVINVNNTNIIHEPTCLLCCHPQRKQIEKEWVGSKSYLNIQQIIGINTKISEDVVDNHMTNHFKAGTKELQKLEYANRIKRLNSVELTTLDRIRSGLSMITERVMGINSITSSPTIDIAEIEKMKSAETARLMGAFTQLVKLQASIMGEMKESGELIIIPKQAFIKVFNQALIDAQTDIEKNIIKKILSNLADINKRTQ